MDLREFPDYCFIAKHNFSTLSCTAPPLRHQSIQDDLPKLTTLKCQIKISSTTNCQLTANPRESSNILTINHFVNLIWICKQSENSTRVKVLLYPCIIKEDF